MTLNVAECLEKSIVNGPGSRYVIWLQGCPFRCKGCFNEAFQPFISKKLIHVSEMLEIILSVKDIEGVTYTGGEPFCQARELYYLSLALKEHDLGIVCYSGFTLKQLRNHKDPFVKRLLEQIDLLIDGRYEEDKKASLLWRGSKNQKVHFLTKRYNKYQSIINRKIKEIELIIGKVDTVFTGFWENSFMKKLNKHFKEGEK